MDHQRSLGPSPFPGDDGAADPATRARLAEAWSDPPATYLRAIATLCTDRLLVPVVATATRLGETAAPQTDSQTKPLKVEKEADMSVVLLQTPDGRRAAVAFTGLDTLESWRADARPVPVTLDLVARSAVSERAVAVIIDPDGPHTLVLDGEILAALAAGHRLIELPDGEFGWAQPTA